MIHRRNAATAGAGCRRARGRFPAALLAAVFAFGLAAPAPAQTNSCDQLNSQLSTLERDRDFQNLGAYSRDARTMAENIQRLESAFVRSGCQRALNLGNRLPRECRQLVNQINRSRADYAALVEHANRGTQIADLRENVLQQIARFNCNNASTVTFRSATPAPNTNRGGLLQRLFGRLGLSGNDFIGDEWGYTGRPTIRTVCVRACDGYYWPVSYATLSEYLQNDALVCSSQCPTAEVELFYYRNPGEEAEDMVNLRGERYADQSYAFDYRREYNPSCACQERINYGTIQFGGGAEAGDASAGGTREEPVIEFGGVSFPLPRRDPRGYADIALAQAVYVPLPRRRPARDGEPLLAVPVAAPAELRLVEFGGKTVRIVGPDTPYVPTPAEGS